MKLLSHIKAKICYLRRVSHASKSSLLFRTVKYRISPNQPIASRRSWVKQVILYLGFLSRESISQCLYDCANLSKISMINNFFKFWLHTISIFILNSIKISVFFFGLQIDDIDVVILMWPSNKIRKFNFYANSYDKAQYGGNSKVWSGVEGKKKS